MTNTTKSQPKPIKCGNCSTFAAPVYHTGVDAVRACFAAKYAPVAPVVSVPTIAEVAELFSAPEATAFGRHFASCPRKGCKATKVADAKFVLRCYAHGKVVKTRSKQLFGKVSTSAKHHCDARCIWAVGPTCVCSCGGAGHGTGHLVTV